MSTETKRNSGNKQIIMIAAVVAAIVIIGGYLYYQKSQTETVSMSLGDHKISASFQKQA